MYAIVKDGGRQYKCEVGRKMFLELREVEAGATLELDQVLLISREVETKDEDGKTKTEQVVTVGQPTIEGAKVVCEVMTRVVEVKDENGKSQKVETTEFKGPKVVIRWFRRRKNSRKKNGHRQTYIQVEVKEIVG